MVSDMTDNTIHHRELAPSEVVRATLLHYMGKCELYQGKGLDDIALAAMKIGVLPEEDDPVFTLLVSTYDADTLRDGIEKIATQYGASRREAMNMLYMRGEECTNGTNLRL